MAAAQGTAAPTHRGAVRSFLHLLSCIRLDEVLVLQGTPLFGALFAMGALTGAKCLKLVVLAAASSCLVAHVFLLNDCCGAGSSVSSTPAFNVENRNAGTSPAWPFPPHWNNSPGPAQPA